MLMLFLYFFIMGLVQIYMPCIITPFHPYTSKVKTAKGKFDSLRNDSIVIG